MSCSSAWCPFSWFNIPTIWTSVFSDYCFFLILFVSYSHYKRPYEFQMEFHILQEGVLRICWWYFLSTCGCILLPWATSLHLQIMASPRAVQIGACKKFIAYCCPAAKHTFRNTGFCENIPEPLSVACENVTKSSCVCFRTCGRGGTTRDLVFCYFQPSNKKMPSTSNAGAERSERAFNYRYSWTAGASSF